MILKHPGLLVHSETYDKVDDVRYLFQLLKGMRVREEKHTTLNEQQVSFSLYQHTYYLK